MSSPITGLGVVVLLVGLGVGAAAQTGVSLPPGAAPLDPGGAVPEVVLSGVRPFDLQATVVRGQPSPTSGCLSISLGQTISGSLTSSDPTSARRPGSFADCYIFQGRAGQQISIQMRGLDEFRRPDQFTDTFLFLVGPDGQAIDSNDDCQGIGFNSCLPRGAVAGGPSLPCRAAAPTPSRQPLSFLRSALSTP